MSCISDGAGNEQATTARGDPRIYYPEFIDIMTNILTPQTECEHGTEVCGEGHDAPSSRPCPPVFVAILTFGIIMVCCCSIVWCIPLTISFAIKCWTAG